MLCVCLKENTRRTANASKKERAVTWTSIKKQYQQPLCRRPWQCISASKEVKIICLHWIVSYTIQWRF